MSGPGRCLLSFGSILLCCCFTKRCEDKDNSPWVAKEWLMQLRSAQLKPAVSAKCKLLLSGSLMLGVLNGLGE